MYIPSSTRYCEQMTYKYCGRSGLMLPRISLGLWHNFGDVDNFNIAVDMIGHAFDNGITHFDLANNYGPPPGSAERNFGKILKSNFAGYRDEMIISSKAGHLMWEGPYGDGSSRKNLMVSIEQSLSRTGLEYFDIFYSHRYDGVTPIEETMQALVDIVHQGKALYAGISKYPPQEAEKAYDILTAAGVKCLIHQDRYSMFSREVEGGTLQLTDVYGCGFIAFSPLAQGLLTDKYLNGIPEDSRAARPTGFLKREQVTEDNVATARQLNQIAQQRGQSLAQMALAWVLKNERVTSVIVGSSSVHQLDDNLKALQNLDFTNDELSAIEQILSSVNTQIPK
ncbi:L-glyceraldehyde 3-phosphate reductase [termite gut metagenome]|uniref:L-glyceraldehyde 3-phosphate reductase n=1 Tax=termite gut metagenome TaxID=433724 RepID=A0A5J4Q712_9ZZZZ